MSRYKSESYITVMSFKIIFKKSVREIKDPLILIFTINFLEYIYLRKKRKRVFRERFNQKID